MINTPVITNVVVPYEAHGQRLDVTLAQLFPDFSRSQLTHWLKEGAITIDEKLRKSKEKVLGGESVQFKVDLKTHNQELSMDDAEDIPLDILYEDEHLLVLNKPTGLVVHPGAGNARHTLVNALLNHDSALQHIPRAGIIHRLDKDTTGLLIVGKTLSAHTHLVRMMQAREIQRSYIALVHGHIVSGATIETCYGRHPRNRLKMSVCSHGKIAITEFTLKKQYQYATLLDVKLMTGRTHQIRVHMDYINHPIVGDALYGGRARAPGGISEQLRTALKQFPRQALHACKLSFKHPITEEFIEVQAPLPDDFQTLITLLDNNFD